MPRLSHLRLTKRAVESAPLPERGETFLWDSEIRGFAVRLYPTGRRVFLYQFQAPQTGQTRRLVLGTFPAITVDQARDLAKSAAGRVAHGEDPKAPHDEKKAATLGLLVPTYLKEREGKIAASTLREYRRVWEKSLDPHFGRRRVTQVDAAMVAQWHADRRAVPYAANREVDFLSGFFAWAERRAYRPRHSNPCAEVERFEEQTKGRSLTEEEYRSLGKALDIAARAGLPTPPSARKNAKNPATKKHRPKSADTPKPTSPYIVGALRFLALSGWREQEALTLRRPDVDFARGVAVLGDTKTGRSERPLGHDALTVLRSLPEVEGNPYFFVGAREGAPVRDPKAAWESVKFAAKLEVHDALRLHDLRHSFTTVARDDLGYGDHIIARLVGHKIAGITSRYGQVRDATLRTAADAIANRIAQHLA